VTDDDRQTIIELRTRLAQYSFALDVLSRMAREVGETAVVDDILDLLRELCAPAFLSYTPIVNGEFGEAVTRGQRPGSSVASDCLSIPADSLTWAEDGDGFTLRLDRDAELLGIVSVEHLPFPENRQYYLDVASEIVGLLALMVSNARLKDTLLHTSTTDDLTKLPNRRSAFQRLHAEMAKLGRSHGTLAVAMFDLDHFKGVNDRHGHHAGDVVLRETADRLGARIRAYDVLARVGGEEFLLIAPDTSLEDARALAERLRRCICEAEFHCGGATIPMTISCGVTIATNRDGSPEDLVARADAGLYESKRAGRNRVTVLPAEPAATKR
jgi:diguanylate cyclase (GGDEF)-like protein